MKRKKIDWEKVEKDYYAKILSMQEVADKHNIADSTLRRHAKKYLWTRDETGEINRRTYAKLADLEAAELKEKFPERSADDIYKSAVETGAIVKANVIVNHRKMLRADIERASKLEVMFDGMLNGITDIRDMATLTQSYKTLVESKAKLITLERQSFKIEDSDAEEGKNQSVRLNVNFV